MVIGTRLRSLRENKGMSQGDVEKITGMLRCYISRVENGHTIPSLQTLERFAGALEVPLQEMFYSGEGEPPTPNLTQRSTLDELAMEPAQAGEDGRFMAKFKRVLDKLGEPDRDVLLTLAKKLATR
jgi:transcriptional regulator with XRE-family HTH domain